MNNKTQQKVRAILDTLPHASADQLACLVQEIHDCGKMLKSSEYSFPQRLYFRKEKIEAEDTLIGYLKTLEKLHLIDGDQVLLIYDLAMN